MVLDRVHVTGVPGVPDPQVKGLAVLPSGYDPMTVVQTYLAGTLPAFKGFVVPPAGSLQPDERVPTVIIELQLPVCRDSDGVRRQVTIAYNQNYLIYYHVQGDPGQEYIALFPYRDVLCLRGKAPLYCHQPPEDWPTLSPPSPTPAG